MSGFQACSKRCFVNEEWRPKESLTYAPILLHLAKSAHGLGVLDKRFTKDFQF